MKPTVGRIVHFNLIEVTSPGSTQSLVPLAAVITRVNKENDGAVDLQVISQNHIYPQYNIAFSEKPKANFWSWPPREEADKAGKKA